MSLILAITHKILYHTKPIIMKTDCIQCGKTYETKRESSLYCSNSCRTGAYKYRKRVEEFEAENKKVLQAQQEAAEKQKLIDIELKIQKAAQRKKAKEDKVLKASMENEKIDNKSYAVEEEIPANEPPPEDFPINPEKPEIKEEPQRHYRPLAIRRKLEIARRPKIDFWDVFGKILKAYNDNNSQK